MATSAYGCSLTIDAVNALQVDEGGTIIVTNGNLRTLDSDDHATALRYEVATAPAHGSLNLSSFIQADIDAG